MKKIFVLLILTIAFPSAPYAQVANGKEVEMILNRHNFWRTEVGVENIKYSEKLARIANRWAIALKNKGCAFKHSQDVYGENLFKGTASYFTVGDAVDSWGEEKKDYNYTKNTCADGKMCGHYTQIVWRKTTEVGCAKNTCDGLVTWVCNYNPPGNFVGKKPY